MAHQSLDVDAVHAERRTGFRHAARVRLWQVGQLEHRAHAAPAAAADGLDHDTGVAALGLLRHKEGLRLGQGDRAGTAGHHGHLALQRHLAGPGLVAKQRQLRGRGPDEEQPRLQAGLREIGALAQETVARMQRVTTVRARDGDQRGAVEVGRRPGCRQRHRAIGPLRVQRLRVVLRVDSDAGDAHIAKRTHQAHGDFAAIGNQHFFEHIKLSLKLSDVGHRKAAATNAKRVRDTPRNRLRRATGVAPWKGGASRRGQAWGRASYFNNRRNTLPAPVVGSASMKTTWRGAL